jgi:hypothetical protein
MSWVKSLKNHVCSRFKRFCCFVGWHGPLQNSDESDPTGFLSYAQCRWCGYKGQLDSHGQLF